MKIWRTIIIHPTGVYNCGDQLTYFGTKSLLAQAVGGHQYLDVLQFDFERAEREVDAYIPQFGWPQVDLIVLAGSPWIWNNCEKSNKYKLLEYAYQRWPNAKRIALGLGSCYGNKCYNLMLMNHVNCFYNSKSMKMLYEVYSKFDLIVVRDFLAKYIFDRLNLPAVDTFDTSVYAYQFLGKKFDENPVPRSNKISFFYDPSFGLSKGDLWFSTDEYNKRQLDWTEKNNAEIYTNSLEDATVLVKNKIPFNFSTDIKFLFHLFQECSEMFSGRIHMGMLGFIAGIPKIRVLPVDSRFMTVLKFPIDVEFVGTPYELPENNIDKSWDNIFKEEDRLVQLIKRILQ